MSQLYIMIIRYYNFFGQQTRVTATLTYTGKKTLKNAFFYKTLPVAASVYFAFHECFFFYFSLAALPLLPYSTVTFFV